MYSENIFADVAILDQLSGIMLGKVAEICVRRSNSQSGMNNSYGLLIFMCDDIHD